MNTANNNSVTRKAEAVWKGDVIGGHGLLSLESGNLHQTRFSLETRNDRDTGTQTTPEELIAGALASCFSIALSKVLTERETVASQLYVTAHVDLERDDDGISLKKLSIDAEGIVPAAEEEEFAEAVEKTDETCLVLQALRPSFDEVDISARLRN